MKPTMAFVEKLHIPTINPARVLFGLLSVASFVLVLVWHMSPNMQPHGTLNPDLWRPFAAAFVVWAGVSVVAVFGQLILSEIPDDDAWNQGILTMFLAAMVAGALQAVMNTLF